MEASKERRNGMILSYVSIIINSVIQLLYTPFLIKMLGQSEYGLYSLVSSIIGYLTIMDLGFGNAIIVYTSKYHAQGKKEDEEKLHGMFNLLFIGIGILAAILGFILYLNMDGIFSNSLNTHELAKAKIMMLILSFNLFITFAFSIYSSIISAYEKFTFKKILAIMDSLLKPILMIPLLFLGFKSITLIVVITIVNVFVCMSNYIFCRKKLNIKTKFKGFDKLIFKVILGYSIYIFLGEIVDKVNWNVDQCILGIVSGTTAVSVYSIAAQLNNMFILFSSTINGVFLPKISKMVAKNSSSEDLSNEFIRIGRIQFYIVFLLCSGFIIYGKQFIRFWVGTKFNTSYYVALFLIIPLCVPLVQTLGLSIMQAMNKYKFRAITTSIMAIFNILISIILTKKFGPVGSAVGTAIAITICNIIIMNYYYHKKLNLDIFRFWKNMFFMIIKYIVPIAIIIPFNIYFKINTAPLFALSIFIYTIMYMITSYLFVMNQNEKEQLNSFIHKIKKIFKKRRKA